MSVQTIKSMVAWVDRHVLENPTLENMSAYVGYSPYYCSSKFREYTGVTYKQYLAKCRLKAAMGMLISSDHKITEIALKCGYSSSESLARSFMDACRCTPTEYRRQHQR